MLQIFPRLAYRAGFLPLFVVLGTIFAPSFVHATKPLAPDTELAVYRFYSSANKASALVAAYKLDGQLFAPKQVGKLTLRGLEAKGCEDALLENLENFALGMMKSVEYLSDDEFANQVATMRRLEPGQVTFIESTRPVPKDEVQAHPELYPLGRRSPRPDIERPNAVHIRQASLWVVSGQVMYPHPREIFEKVHPNSLPTDLHFRGHMGIAPESESLGPRVITVSINAMPWQQDDELWKSGKMPRSEFGYAQLDRKKYPLVWEFGRMAQVEPEQMYAVQLAAMTVVQEELEVSLQADPSEAYIFAHALDRPRMRLFRLMGFEPLDPDCTGENGCIMVAAYVKLIKNFPPGALSKRVQEIRKIFNNGIDNPEALNILRRTQTYFRAELDMVSEEFGIEQKSPIVLHDFSRSYDQLLGITVKHWGQTTDDEARAGARWLKSIRNDHTANNSIRDSIPVEPFVELFSKADVVRLTNLDPALIQNKNYFPLVLLGAYRYLISRYTELHIENPVDQMKRIGTQIVIQTTNLAVLQAGVDLGGVPGPPLPGADGRNLYVVSFSLERIEALQVEHANLNRAAEHALQQGFWFFRNIGSLPMKF